MKADTTRRTFQSWKHYRSVLMQQGRVQLDADWNEQIEIAAHRVETGAIDEIGPCGAPMHEAGFHLVASANDLSAQEKTLPENQNPPALSSNGDFLISGGRYYVDGILCENEQIVSFTHQLDLPNTQPVAQAGTYLAYLDVWPRHITALEDPHIREVALGGPDTATRVKTVWQVKLFRAGDVSLAATCSTVFNTWNDQISPGTGKLAAQAATSAPSNNPCVVAPGAGYRRLENQHYRVEVHDAGTLGTATFKWSRDNGSIVTKWESQDVNNLTVSSIGRDKVLNFASGQWVELTDDTHELLGTTGTLVQLVKAEGNVLTINPATATGPTNLTNFPTNPKVRRWDMSGLLKPTTTSWIDLEDGVQVQFASGTFKTGDYWLIPARTATANVEWPTDPNTNLPIAQLPQGIHHHYCRLSIMKFDGTKWTSVTDCRDLFPPLTELTSFFYVGGDGQEAMPDLTQPTQLTPLAAPLEVGVANGQWPVAGATVRFTVTKGSGQLQGVGSQVKVTTNANGIAGCAWSLSSSPQNQQVEAVLLDDNGNPINLPIHFNANLSVADQVAYDPKQCGALQGQKTVQKAIDTLSKQASLFPVSGDNQSILPTDKLAPLVVVASNKCGGVAGMQVQFSVITGGGKVMPQGGTPQGTGATVTVTTDAQGLASCDWTLGSSQGSQIVEAVLQGDANHPTVPPVKVRFTAQFQGVTADPGFHVTGLVLLASNAALRNDSDIQIQQLAKGVRFDCDDSPDPAALTSKHPRESPVCFVTIDLPFPMVPQDRDFLAAPSPCVFQPTVLGAQVSAADKQILWVPQDDVMAWLARLTGILNNLKLPLRLLARLTLKGNFIWAKGRPNVYLDAETYGLVPNSTPNDLSLPTGDQRRGGDMEMWFWLVSSPPKTSDKVGDKTTDKIAKEVEKATDAKAGDKTVEKVAEKVVEGKSAEAVGPSPSIGLLSLDTASFGSTSGSLVGRSFIRPEERPSVTGNLLDEPRTGSPS